MTLKPCLECGEPADGTRCPDHPAPDRSSRKHLHIWRSRRWTRLSKRLRRMQPWCSTCGSRDDLTVDHRVPLNRGGDPFDLDNLDVLCRPCNSAKGDRDLRDDQGGHPDDLRARSARQAQNRFSLTSRYLEES